MCGRGHTPSWSLLTVTAVCALLLAAPPSGDAGRAGAITRLRAEDTALAAEARSAVLQLYALDAHLGAARARLAQLQARAERLRDEQLEVGRELRLAILDDRLSEQRVASRLRYLYDYGGGTSSLDVVLGATSLDQVLTRLDDVDAVAAANQSVVSQLESARSRLSGLARELTRRRLRLSATTDAVGATVATLGEAQTQRSAYLAALENRRAYDAAAIVRLNAAAEAAVARSLALARTRALARAEAIHAAHERLDITLARPVQAAGLVVGAQAGPAAPPPTLTPTLSPTTAGSPLPSGASFTGGGRTITVVATGYDLGGHTSTGLPVGYGVAAVDPSVIPLGTRFNVPGYGEAIAADTGGSIVGTRIDLWFPSAAQADAWGRRTVTVVLGG